MSSLSARVHQFWHADCGAERQREYHDDAIQRNSISIVEQCVNARHITVVLVVVAAAADDAVNKLI